MKKSMRALRLAGSGVPVIGARRVQYVNDPYGAGDADGVSPGDTSGVGTSA
jgi:hypothetical protein